MQETKRHGFDPWVRKIPWRRAWQTTPVFLPGESPRTEEPGGLQPMGSQRVGHDWATDTALSYNPCSESLMPMWVCKRDAMQEGEGERGPRTGSQGWTSTSAQLASQPGSQMIPGSSCFRERQILTQAVRLLSPKTLFLVNRPHVKVPRPSKRLLEGLSSQALRWRPPPPICGSIYSFFFFSQSIPSWLLWQSSCGLLGLTRSTEGRKANWDSVGKQP